MNMNLVTGTLIKSNKIPSRFPHSSIGLWVTLKFYSMIMAKQRVSELGNIMGRRAQEHRRKNMDLSKSLYMDCYSSSLDSKFWQSHFSRKHILRDFGESDQSRNAKPKNTKIRRFLNKPAQLDHPAMKSIIYPFLACLQTLYS